MRGMSASTRITLAIFGGLLLGFFVAMLDIAYAFGPDGVNHNETAFGFIGAGLALGFLFASLVGKDAKRE